MASNHTLLCIHRDPAQLSLLKENGYELVTAGSGADAVQLFMSLSVDAVVLDYELSLLQGAAVAAEMKKVKPQVPIVMLTDHLELTDDTLKSVDALVKKSDSPHFLWATVHFILNVKPAQHLEERIEGRHVCVLPASRGKGGTAADQPCPNGQVTRRPSLFR